MGLLGIVQVPGTYTQETRVDAHAARVGAARRQVVGAGYAEAGARAFVGFLVSGDSNHF